MHVFQIFSGPNKTDLKDTFTHRELHCYENFHDETEDLLAWRLRPYLNINHKCIG